MNNLRILWTKDVPSYICEIVVNNYCKSILPASMIINERGRIFTFELAGRQQILLFNEPIKALEIFLKVTQLVDDLEDYLIFYGTYDLSLKLLFINLRTNKLEIALLPKNEKNTCHGLLNILNEMMENSNEKCKEYLSQLKPYVTNENYDRKQLIQIIERLCEEIDFLA